MDMDEIEEICNQLGIQFAVRSWGKTTTRTVTLDALQKLVLRCLENQEKQKKQERTG